MTEQQRNIGATVGATIRHFRTQQHRSLRALAQQLEVSPATLSAIETGKTAVTLTRLAQVAELLHVPLTRLLEPAPAPMEVPRPTPTAPHWREYPPLELAPGLEAAMQVFVQRGFHAASMRDVAEVAGMSVAGIYHHHASKAAILEQLFELTMSEIHWRVPAARDDNAADPSQTGAFARMVESLALFHAIRGELAFLGASEMRGLPPAARERMRRSRSAMQHLLDQQALAAIAAGELASPDPFTACRAIATMCTSLPSWFRLDGPLPATVVARRYAEFGVKLLRPTT